MNKTAIKSIALSVRKKLRIRIENTVQLENEDEIEDVIYQWFRRLICIIYMDINGFLHKEEDKTLSSSKGNAKCRILRQWSTLHQILPIYFESPYEEHFLPEDLESIISVFRDTDKVLLEDWRQPEILGWFYQYFFFDKHDEVTGINKSRISEEYIQAVTQLFTPKWIVEYMVDNSLGRYWMESTGDCELVKSLKFYIPSNGSSTSKKIEPKEIKLLERIIQRLIQFNEPQTCCA